MIYPLSRATNWTVEDFRAAVEANAAIYFDGPAHPDRQRPLIELEAIANSRPGWHHIWEQIIEEHRARRDGRRRQDAVVLSTRRARLERHLRILEHPDPASEGWFAVEIAAGGTKAAYLARAVSGGYELEKLDADLEAIETYYVALGRGAASCTCRGFEHRGHCKHVVGLLALKRSGALNTCQAATDAARSA